MTYLFKPYDGEVKNDTGNPLPVSKNTDDNSAENRIFVDTGLTIPAAFDGEIKNDSGNPIPISKNTSTNSDINPIFVKGTSDSSFFAPTQSDAFGRLRVSDAYTLFDSFHRYQDNGSFSVDTANGGASSHDANSSSIDMSVSTTSGSYVKRETNKVFAYQPGKSLQIFNTFAMNTPKANLRQRIGYFDTNNGIFLEQNGTTLSFVRRTSSSGTLQEYRVNQADWNVNTLMSNGNSTLFVDRSQIFWMDIEWLGVGSVRCGFVIDGAFVHCHTFNHANKIDPITSVGIATTYMGTAILPIRMEIENTAATSSVSSMKVICSTVISEGGYSESGRPKSIGHPINGGYSISSANTLYPIFSMRLKGGRLSGLVLPKTFGISVTGNTNYRWVIIKGGTTTGGTWTDASSTNSSVEYKLDATSISGGDTLDMGYIINANQGIPTPSNTPLPFKYQLERNSFTSSPIELTICVETSGNNQTGWATFNWEEMT